MKRITIIQPFRKGKIKEIIVKNYANMEVINVAPLQMASLLEDQGYDVEFISLQNIFRSFEKKNYTELYNIIENLETDCIVFHTDYYMSNTNTASLFSINLISNYIKQRKIDIPIILTGKIVEGLKTSLFDYVPSIDVAIKGEGEDIIVPLLKELSEKSEISCAYKTKAIIYKHDGLISENDGVGFIIDYNTLPIPNYDLLETTLLLIENSKNIKIKVLPISIRTTYGCPFNCHFCSGTKNWNKYRIKTKSTLHKELIAIKNSCLGKLKVVFLADEVFTFDSSHVHEVADLLVENNIMLAGLFAHARLFDEKIAEEVKRISHSVLFGAENCDDTILKKANKNIEFEDILLAAKIAKKMELEVGLEWIIGLPGETIFSVANNLNCMYSLIMSSSVDFIEPYVLCIHPNTVFSNDKSKYGVKVFGSLEYMMEEGGYPQYYLENSLSSNQIFVYYLLALIMISDAKNTKGFISEPINFREFNIEEFEILFNMIQ